MDTDRLVHDVIAVLADFLPDGDTADNRKLAQAIADLLSRSLGTTPDGAAAWEQFITAPKSTDQQRALANALRQALTTDPAFAQLLASMTSAAEKTDQPYSTAPTTVTAGRDQKIKGIVNVGGGSLTVNKTRNIRLGIGALALLVVGGATTGAVYLFQGSPDAQLHAPSPPPATGNMQSSSVNTCLLDGVPDTTTPGPEQCIPVGELPSGPLDSVDFIYQAIGDTDRAKNACLAFNNHARTQFTKSSGTTTCAQAIEFLHHQVTSSSYGGDNDPDLASLGDSQPAIGPTYVVSPCSYVVTGGPHLGEFTLTEMGQAHWLITNYSAQTACP